MTVELTPNALAVLERRWGDAVVALDRARTVAKRVGLPFTDAWARVLLAEVRQRQGDPADAARLLRHVEQDFGQTQEHGRRAVAQAQLGLVALDLGDADDAQRRLAAAEAILDRVQGRSWLTWRLIVELRRRLQSAPEAEGAHG